MRSAEWRRGRRFAVRPSIYTPHSALHIPHCYDRPSHRLEPFGCGPHRGSARAARGAHRAGLGERRSRGRRDPHPAGPGRALDRYRRGDGSRGWDARVAGRDARRVSRPDGATVLTHCNAGALATGGIGTALAPIYLAHDAGRRVHVFVDETRPVLQGARLTAWELTHAGIPCTVIADGAAGSLMRQAKVDLVLVGADRIAVNGDFANKIGTYSLAVLALHHGVPFYCAAPSSTIDVALADGAGIPIEQRAPDEVKSVAGRLIAPAEATALNPAFDVTPARYVTAFITFRGVRHPPFRDGERR